MPKKSKARSTKSTSRQTKSKSATTAKQGWKLKDEMTWQVKLTTPHPSHGKTVPIPDRWQRRYGRGRMLIPRPLDIQAKIKAVRKGKLMTTSKMRQILAEDAGVKATCPLTTGIFLRIVAEAAEEQRAAGKTRVAPYWRVIKDRGELNDKFPGGAAAQAKRLRAEGLPIEQKGKAFRVIDFEDHVV